ncbi:hypothetical protein ACODT3_38360 [Streptomyces sp. 4.24]|uniref:hypothetical protein n=1 Tax=Streptomyces tritrimontium TaxID=3406573 RepID=UPI003BB6F9E9
MNPLQEKVNTFIGLVVDEAEKGDIDLRSSTSESSENSETSETSETPPHGPSGPPKLMGGGEGFDLVRALLDVRPAPDEWGLLITRVVQTLSAPPGPPPPPPPPPPTLKA